jgi:hypothetical protein
MENEIKGFQVICDKTNNTEETINNEELFVDIIITDSFMIARLMNYYRENN